MAKTTNQSNKRKEQQQAEATAAAIAAALAEENTSKELDFIKIIEDSLQEEGKSQLVDVIKNIMANDFEQTPEGNHTLKETKKLGLFSLGLINAVSCSFLGLPAAAILVGLDNLFTNPIAAGILTGPDKLLLIIIALIILAIFIKIAYKQNYEDPKQESEYLKYISDVFAQYICSTPPVKDILNKAIYNKYLATSIQEIREAKDQSSLAELASKNLNSKLLLAEIKFKKAALTYSFARTEDNNQEKIDNVMRVVNYLTTFLVMFLTSYFLAIAITASVMPVLYIIPIVCTILLAQQAVKYAATDYYKPKQYLTIEDDYYLSLYRVMRKYRENNSIDLGKYIKKIADSKHMEEAIIGYLEDYKNIDSLDQEELQKVDNAYIKQDHDNYRKRFHKIGLILGTTNAVLNGILCCALGIMGIVAVITIFFPAFHLSIAGAIIISIALFLGGTIHSFRFTRNFITTVFSNFGQTLDNIRVSEKNLSKRDWLSILTQKIKDNRRAIIISVFTSIALSVLGFVAIAHLLTTFPIGIGTTIIILAVTTLLNFTACTAIFTETLQSSNQKAKYEAKLRESVNKDEKDNAAKLQARIKKHYILMAIITLIVFTACLSPLFSLTVVPAILIGFTTFVAISIASAVIDYNNICELNQPLRDIISLRVKICLIILFGLAFGLSSGPAVATLLFGIMPATVLPATVILTLSTLAGIAIGTSLCYAYGLVYWNAALKPERPQIWENVEKELIDNNSNTMPNLKLENQSLGNLDSNSAPMSKLNPENQSLGNLDSNSAPMSIPRQKTQGLRPLGRPDKKTR